MGKRFFILFFLLLSLLLSSMLSATEARALRGLSLRAVKVSGPSPGVGHRYKNLQTIGLENSGPGPGEGHK